MVGTDGATGATGATGAVGAEGESAYDLYVDSTLAVGGTPLALADWLNSLIGATGADGQSAYDLYVETTTTAGGTPLNLTDWLAGLAGVDGINGTDGIDGQSAYDLYVETTTTAGGTPLNLTDWLASLVGTDGATGATGATGASGAADLITGITLNADVDANGQLTQGELRDVAPNTLSIGLSAKAQVNDIITVNGSPYILDQTDIDNAAIEVSITVLDGLNFIRVEALNADGQTDVDFKFFEVLEGDYLGEIDVFNDLDNNNVIDNGELGVGSTVDVNISLGADVREGDIVTLNGATHTVDGTDITNRFVTFMGVLVPQGQPETLLVEITSAGNVLETASEEININGAARNILENIVFPNDINADDALNAVEMDGKNYTPIQINLGVDAQIDDIVVVNGDKYILNATEVSTGILTVNVAVRQGVNPIQVTATDEWGNVDRVDSPIIVDALPPAAPILAPIAIDNVPLIEDIIVNGAITNDNLPEITGAGQLEGEIITLYINGVEVTGSDTPIVVESTGAWNYIPTTVLPDNDYVITYTVTDSAGNISLPSPSLSFEIDTAIPVVNITAVTPVDINNPVDNVADLVVITGTSDELNAAVIIKDKDGNQIGTATTDGTGAFSITLDTAAVQAGDNVKVEVTDKAGNTGSTTEVAGILTFEPLVLVDDDVSTSLADQNVDTANKLATYNEGAILGILEGQSQIATVDFTVSDTAKDAVIVVESQNLVTVANAFSFEVVNNATGEVFTVATASSSQGGLVTGALGLQALGVIDDGAGLRLDIKDLPSGNYSVIVHGDSSRLADILETVKLSELGSNTVNDVIQDTVKGLVKEVLVNANDIVLEGVLEQLTLQEVLDLAKTTNVSTALIDTVEVLLDTVDSVLAVLNPIGLLGDNTAVAAELLNTSVGDILAGNSTGLLGSLISDLGLGATLGGLVNGLLVQVDNLGEVIYNEVVEPLIDVVITDALLQNTGLADLLGGLLGGVNQILNGLGLGSLLPTADGLLTLVAENILSNPVSLFPDVTADVYAVNEKTYIAEGNVLDNDHVEIGSIITQVNGNPINFDQTDVNSQMYAEISGSHGTLHLYEDGHYIYTAVVAADETAVLMDQFTYTVQDQNSNVEDAVLTITTDPENETIDFSSTVGNNILQGGSGDDILTGGEGIDTAIYYLLDNLDATGGNGTDTWTDFTVGSGADKIDVSALLDGLQTATNIGSYISVKTNADGDAVITIDRDGAGTEFATKSDLLILTGVDAISLGGTPESQLQALLDNNQIIF